MRFLSIALLTSALFAPSAHADAPSTQPAPKALFNGHIEYSPPAGWQPAESKQTSDMAHIYIADDHDGYFAIQVLPVNALVSPAAAQKIVQQLHANHKRAGQEVVQEPKIEKDPRFAIKIHERYRTKEGKTADETHLYRQVAGRALELDVQSLSEEQAHIDEVIKVGEEVLASAHWKGTAPPKK